MPRYAAKVDTTSKPLAALGRSWGALWLPWPGGPIDGFFLWRGRIIPIDWKSKGGKLTKKQVTLVRQGWPIQFPKTPLELQSAFARIVSRDAGGWREVIRALPIPADDRTGERVT